MKDELSVETNERDEREAELQRKLKESNEREVGWLKRERALKDEKEDLDE